MKILSQITLCLFLSLLIPQGLFSQARVVLNSDFEQPLLANPNTWGLVHHSAVPGWSTTSSSGQIEFWRAPFQGVIPPSGQQHIELNANQPADLYFDACLFDGETITWSFYHRGRAGRDSARLLIGPSGAEVEVLRFGTGNNAWVQYSGTFVNTYGNTSIRFRFQPISTASGNLTVGNFIDNVEITGLAPIVEFEQDQYSDIEATGGNLPNLRVNGRIPTGGLTIDLLVTGGTATGVDDYNLIVPFTIPEGDYDGNSTISLSSVFNIVDDAEAETDETIEISLANPQAPLMVNDANCDGVAQAQSTYTILDDDALFAVELNSFELENIDCASNLLRWNTAVEEQHDYFVVEHSTDALYWQEVDQVWGAAIEGAGSDYEFEHYTNATQHYYRLKMVDQDGMYTYSPVKYLETDCSPKPSIQIYPNPVFSN